MNPAIAELIHELEDALRDLDFEGSEDAAAAVEQLIEDVRQTGSETTRRAAIIEGLVMFSMLDHAEELIKGVL